MATIIKVKWYKNWGWFGERGWEMDDGNTICRYPFSRSLLKREYKLRSPSFFTDFTGLFNSSRLPADIKDYTLTYKNLIIILENKEGYWYHPWEATVKLIEALINKPRLRLELNNLTITRTTSDAPPFSPSIFENSLKILILLGNDGSKEGQSIPIKETANAILDSWKNLTFSEKRRIQMPEIAIGSSVNIEDLLRHHKPDLLWFNGHGRGKKSPGIKLDDGWFSPEQLSEVVSKSGINLKFCIFWSCDTAEKEEKDFELNNYPAFYKALLKNNVLTFVGMQSLIRVSNAEILALETLRNLASGNSMEVSVSRARHHLFRNSSSTKSGKDPQFDWASPVIWSIADVSDKYNWNGFGSGEIQSQWAMVEILRQQANSLSIENITATQLPQLDITGILNRTKNSWIDGDIQNHQNLLSIGAAILKKMSDSSQPLLIINLRTLAVAEGAMNDLPMEVQLKEWASRIIASALPGNMDEQTLALVKRIDEYPNTGFRELFEKSKLKIILLWVETSPRQLQSDNWFWDIVENNPGNVIVFSNNAVQNLELEFWEADNLKIMEYNDSTLNDALEDDRDLCKILAVMDKPVGMYFFSKSGLFTKSIEDWKFQSKICCRTTEGILIYSSARNYILKALSEEEKKEAHQQCFKILQLMADTGIEHQELLFYHSNNGIMPVRRELADSLILDYQDQKRYVPILKLESVLGYTFSGSLTEDARLNIVWAHTIAGNTERALTTANRITPVNSLNKVFKHLLLAEIYKGLGLVDKCMAELDEGIAKLNELTLEGKIDSEEITKRLQQFKNDRARALHYLFYDYDQAIIVYQELITELEKAVPTDGVAKAIALRNLSECQRSKYKLSPDVSSLDDAEKNINEAFESMSTATNDFVRSELHYERAKFYQFKARLETDETGSKSYLARYREELSSCIRISKTAYQMLYAISLNRYIWDFQLPTEIANDKEIQIFTGARLIIDNENELLYFKSHGWAKRTLLNSKIKRAGLLYLYEKKRQVPDFSKFQMILQESRDIVLMQPVLQGGISDKERILKIWAGLAFANADPSIYNEGLKQFAWAIEQAKAGTLRNPEELWQ